VYQRLGVRLDTATEFNPSRFYPMPRFVPVKNPTTIQRFSGNTLHLLRLFVRLVLNSYGAKSNLDLVNGGSHALSR
jgi:hypothetical protein